MMHGDEMDPPATQLSEAPNDSTATASALEQVEAPPTESTEAPDDSTTNVMEPAKADSPATQLVLTLAGADTSLLLTLEFASSIIFWEFTIKALISFGNYDASKYPRIVSFEERIFFGYIF
ncbi:unnamed protein product [Ambrosiozyma monospora]|uniref:Unnamed protein product n=1 Tax=Ambrosiozyma monospora TaxID=43982 RepID=A0A9W6WJ89_AMBMO|nr:unnamed protein product [Ambrosiozyma monospora]